jgi:hypothetical protein
VTVYRVPAAVPHTAAPAAPSADRWALGLAASYQHWPQDRYEFRLPGTGLPLYAEHEYAWAVTSGFISAALGAARYFAEVDNVGLICLIEVESPSVMWDWARGVRAGLSVCAHHPDEAPDGGLIPVHFSEVSLAGTPTDPAARVVSLGQMALDDWQWLTHEEVTP